MFDPSEIGALAVCGFFAVLLLAGLWTKRRDDEAAREFYMQVWREKRVPYAKSWYELKDQR